MKSATERGFQSLSHVNPWTSGCYARIAGLEMMLEIRQKNRLRRLQRFGLGMVLLGSAAIAAAVLAPF